MRDYELTVIFRADLEDEARAQLIERVKGWLPLVEGEDVPEVTMQDMGRRQLAYPIKKRNDGYYVMFEARLNGQGLHEMEQNMQYVDDILRHLVVRKDD